jgi:hypothetical protein
MFAARAVAAPLPDSPDSLVATVPTPFLPVTTFFLAALTVGAVPALIGAVPPALVLEAVPAMTFAHRAPDTSACPDPLDRRPAPVLQSAPVSQPPPAAMVAAEARVAADQALILAAATVSATVLPRTGRAIQIAGSVPQKIWIIVHVPVP